MFATVLHAHPAPAPSGIAIQEIRWLPDLAALQPAWERLLAACPHATPFQTPQWLLPWLEVYGDAGLRALALWRRGQLVGLAPLRIDVRPSGPVLAFVAAGISDYHGVLAEPGDAGDATRAALLEHLARARAARRDGWTACELEQLPPDEPLGGAGPPGLPCALYPQDVCPYLPLPATRAELIAQLPSQLGPRLERCLRRLRRAGALTLPLADAATLQRCMEAFFALHAARWSERHQPGVTAAPELRRFHAEVARRMLAAGRLRLHVMCLDGEPRAAVYAFALGRRVFSYLGGFDPALARYSPGLVLLYHAMACAIGEGATEMDLLRGDEPYKLRLGARQRWNRRLVLWPDARTP